MDIKPIQTRYAGCHFRSRIEARYAVFFDALGVEWEYEKEGFDLGSLGWYLPDFYLPLLNCFIEIKGKSATTEEVAKAASVSTIADIFLFAGNIGDGAGEYGNPLYSDNTPSAICFSKGVYYDSPMKFSKCDVCGSIDIVFDGWVHYSGRCKCYDSKHKNKMGAFHPDILKALDSARSARFEHRECGAT